MNAFSVLCFLHGFLCQLCYAFSLLSFFSVSFLPFLLHPLFLYSFPFFFTPFCFFFTPFFLPHLSSVLSVGLPVGQASQIGAHRHPFHLKASLDLPIAASFRAGASTRVSGPELLEPRDGLSSRFSGPSSFPSIPISSIFQSVKICCCMCFTVRDEPEEKEDRPTAMKDGDFVISEEAEEDAVVEAARLELLASDGGRTGSVHDE